MSNLPIFDVAGSALQAQSVRLNTIASNLADDEDINHNRELLSLMLPENLKYNSMVNQK